MAATNTKCGLNTDKATCEGGDGSCEFVDKEKNTEKPACVAKNTDYCDALYDKAKCLNAISCWPEINSDKYSDIRDEDQRVKCREQAMMPQVACDPTNCDAGSHVVPSFLFGLMALTAVLAIADSMM